MLFSSPQILSGWEKLRICCAKIVSGQTEKNNVSCVAWGNSWLKEAKFWGKKGTWEDFWNAISLSATFSLFIMKQNLPKWLIVFYVTWAEINFKEKLWLITFRLAKDKIKRNIQNQPGAKTKMIRSCLLRLWRNWIERKSKTKSQVCDARWMRANRLASLPQDIQAIWSLLFNGKIAQ